MDRLEFTPSAGFIALSAASPALLLGLGAWGIIGAGQVRTLPLVLVVLGIGLALVAAFDVPFRIIVDDDGVTRRCLLRRQRFAWDDVVAFRRPQPRRGRRGISQAVGGPGGDGEPMSAPGKGGLLLETRARRQYLLSLGRERPATYGAIEEAVRRHAPGLSMPGPPHFAKADNPL